MPKKVTIVGGGITGLAAAYRLERITDAEIELHESSDRLGGKLQTRWKNGFLIEEGPDCFFARKPGMMQSIRELGLESETIEPLQKEFFMLVDGKLHRVPGGLVTFTYSSPDAIEKASFLSEEAKERALAEADHPVGNDEDESLRSFFSRRFGPEFSRLVAEPLLAGTHAGDPEKLSMGALYPGYLNLERKHGSLSAGMNQAHDAKGASFLSFRGGMETLVTALTGRLTRTRVHLNSRVQGIGDEPTLLAIPANHAAPLLADESRHFLEQIGHNTSAIVTLAFNRIDIGHALDGTGFLVPPSADLSITGATWSSRKWAGRAPDDQVLIRVFMGGDRSRLESAPDDQLVREAMDGISGVMGIQGEPHLAEVSRWVKALPQYNVGHLELVGRIEASLPRHIHVAGTSYRGVGVPDSLRQGLDAAVKIAEQL
ncbi:MAG: protoporphyrinogen oxidase [Fimbriimonas sp.]